MGLLNMLMPGSPAASWVGANPYRVGAMGTALSSVGRGLVGHGSDMGGLLQGLNDSVAASQGPVGQYMQMQRQQDQQTADVEKAQEQQNQTIAYLQKNGRDDLAAAIGAGLPAQEALKMSFENKTANGETFFGNGVPIQNADGSVSYGQFGNQGSFNVPKLPDGSRFLTPVEQLNTGTGFTAVDKFGNPTGQVTPIDNRQKAYDTSFGEGAGKAAIDRINSLPQTLATADNMLGTIDGILNDPALDYSTGWLAWMQGVPNTDQYRFGQRALQLQGQAFLQAFESLKGGGQITEVEGAKATQAIGRLSTSQSPQDYRAALDELKGIINAAKSRAQQQAAGLVQTPYTPGGVPPASGGVVDYRTYFGGQ